MDEQVSAPPETMTVETQQDARSAAEVERERIKSIGAMCRQHGMPEGMADDLVDAGVSVDQAREQVLSKIGKRSRELQPGGLHVEADALIGMDKRDLSRYSMMKLLRHLADPTNQALRDAAASGSLKGYLATSDEPLVSIDYKGNPYSSIADLMSTMVVDGDLVKVVSWYDNEWGYSTRMVDLVEYVHSFEK